LGRGSVQQEAITEVLALPMDDRRRNNVLQLFVNWKISLELREKLLILRQLTQQFGKLAKSITQQVESLDHTQLEDLGEALLDFSSLSDLIAWLARQGQ